MTRFAPSSGARLRRRGVLAGRRPRLPASAVRPAVGDHTLTHGALRRPLPRPTSLTGEPATDYSTETNAGDLAAYAEHAYAAVPRRGATRLRSAGGRRVHRHLRRRTSPDHRREESFRSSNGLAPAPDAAAPSRSRRRPSSRTIVGEPASRSRRKSSRTIALERLPPVPARGLDADDRQRPLALRRAATVGRASTRRPFAPTTLDRQPGHRARLQRQPRRRPDVRPEPVRRRRLSRAGRSSSTSRDEVRQRRSSRRRSRNGAAGQTAARPRSRTRSPRRARRSRRSTPTSSTGSCRATIGLVGARDPPPAVVRRRRHRRDRREHGEGRCIRPGRTISPRGTSRSQRGDGDGSHACYAAHAVGHRRSFRPARSSQPYFFWDVAGSTPQALSVNGSTATHHGPVGHVRLGIDARAGSRCRTRARPSTAPTSRSPTRSRSTRTRPRRPASAPTPTSIWGTPVPGPVGRRRPDASTCSAPSSSRSRRRRGSSGSSSTRAASARSTRRSARRRSARAGCAPATTTSASPCRRACSPSLRKLGVGDERAHADADVDRAAATAGQPVTRHVSIAAAPKAKPKPKKPKKPKK